MDFDSPGYTTELNDWWTLSPEVQESVIAVIPKKDSWQFNLTKNITGVWVFSLPQYKINNESLCNGTEFVVDKYFSDLTGKQPVAGDMLETIVSSKPNKGFVTTWTWLNSAPSWQESNYYNCNKTQSIVWLCPVLQVLFKEVPETLYISYSLP